MTPRKPWKRGTTSMGPGRGPAITAQLSGLVLRPTSPSLTRGVSVGAFFIVAETFLSYPLSKIADPAVLAVVYLVGVVVVSIVWGFLLATAIAAISAAAFDYFYTPPLFHVSLSRGADWVALGTFVVVALLTNAVADLARSRAKEASLRGLEANALAKQQSALRRVATRVAQGVDPSEVFAAVVEEMAVCLDVGSTQVIRYDGNDAAIVLATYDRYGRIELPVGGRITLEGDNVAATVLRTSQAARMDSYDGATGSLAASVRELGITAVAAAPVLVGGRVWGAALVGSRDLHPLPTDVEKRITDFADLVATAIASAATRADLQASRDSFSALAEQQAALRRVATLVARGAKPSEVFAAVAEEIVHCLDVDTGAVWRYESDDAITLVAVHNRVGSRYLQVGECLPIEGDNLGAMVLHSGHAVRQDWTDHGSGPLNARIREHSIREGVGVPIMVDARIWGLAIAATSRSEPMPPDAEQRIADFADLVATAIANAVARSELIASRARIVRAGDNARRRLERDLHDGAQQRLVSLGLLLRRAEADVPSESAALRRQVSEVVSGLTDVLGDLQEISRGIHPAILAKGGLEPALKTLGRRSTVPVILDVAIEQPLAESVSVGAYFVIAEALTNAAKHAEASVVHVHGETDQMDLYLRVEDDGVGGADAGKGSGLIGLFDRVEALGGHMRIDSPPGAGTTLHITIPLHQGEAR